MSNSVFIDRSDIAKDWHARGFSCGLWIDHAGREWSNHPRQTDELFMMMSGELELELEGQSIRPSVGEEIRIPAGMPHTIRNIGGKTARWLYGQPRRGSHGEACAFCRTRAFIPSRIEEKATARKKRRNNRSIKRDVKFRYGLPLGEVFFSLTSSLLPSFAQRNPVVKS